MISIFSRLQTRTLRGFFDKLNDPLYYKYSGSFEVVDKVAKFAITVRKGV